MSDLPPADVNFINDFLVSTPSDLAKLVGRLRNKEQREPLTTYEKALVKLHNAAQASASVIDLSRKDLDILPREIEVFSSKLIELDLSHNNLTSLPTSLSRLRKLERLSLEDNGLTHLIPEVCSLISLDFFSVQGNNLTELPPEIGALFRLKSLDVSNNRLRTLPKSLKNLYLDEFHAHGNRFKIPPEMSARPTREVIIFILQSANQDARSISEAKVLFVGEGGVGKTSIVKKMTEGTFDEREPKTEGILIKKWHVEVYGSWTLLNVWDFGGQEIMHATHQFFLTERSVYVLVWDARQEDDYGQLEYWLNIIDSFGNRPPVIVVLNKTDVGLTEIDRRGLQSKFSSIKAFVNCSCLTGRGIEELKDLICWHARQLAHVTTIWPAKWFFVKDQLEQANKDYISLAEYDALCAQAGIDHRDDRVSLLQFLHDLGVVLSFQRDIRLCDTNVLNPEWATGGVYRILNDSELFGRGLLDFDDIARILDDLRYPRQKHGFIINLMHKFELCYQIDESKYNARRFLIPDLLTKEQPFFKWDFRYSLAFQYHYNFLPSSIMSRFIVRMHHLIDKNWVWRTGVILRDGKNRALIVGDIVARKVYIYVDGLQTTRRDLLAKIRATFEYLHGTIPRIEGTAKVPLPEDHSIVIDYQHLLNLEALREKDFIPEGLRRRVTVYELLVGVGKGGQRGTEQVRHDVEGVAISIVNNVTGIEEKRMVAMKRTNKIQVGGNLSMNQSQILLDTIRSNVSNQIAQIPIECADLKRYLEELGAIIEQDPILPDNEKAVALKKTGFLAQLASKAAEATDQMIEDSIRAIRGTIVEGSTHLFETGREILSQISKHMLGSA